MPHAGMLDADGVIKAHGSRRGRLRRRESPRARPIPLHAHCLVFNATHDEFEQAWKAAQFRHIKREAPYDQAAFHSRLAQGLPRIGYPITRTATGWDLDRIPRDLVREVLGAHERDRGVCRLPGTRWTQAPPPARTSGRQNHANPIRLAYTGHKSVQHTSPRQELPHTSYCPMAPTHGPQSGRPTRCSSSFCNWKALATDQ